MDLFKVVAFLLETEWISILHTFFPRGHNLEGKSNSRRSPRVHKASTMLWRKGSKPSFARLNNKVWVPFKVLPVVAISFPPPLLVSKETRSLPDDVQLNHKGVPHLYLHKIFGYRTSKRRLVFLSFLMSLGKFSIIFLSKYMTKNLVRMLLLLSDFSTFVFGLHVGFLLYRKIKLHTSTPLPFNS